jgi:hypothetical protein
VLRDFAQFLICIGAFPSCQLPVPSGISVL